ncbi:MAG: hypothetical protein MZV64_18990 [Ignavibacteriales bacterium]|nr:hypothetical protein [Ignavibacteriales bacterium]
MLWRIPTATADHLRSQLDILLRVVRHVFRRHVIHALFGLDVHVRDACIRLHPQREVRHGRRVFLDHRFHVLKRGSAVRTDQYRAHLGISLDDILGLDAHHRARAAVIAE